MIKSKIVFLQPHTREGLSYKKKYQRVYRLRRLAEWLRDRGAEVHFVIADLDHSRRDFVDFAHAVRLDSSWFDIHPFERGSKKMAHVVREINPDLLFVKGLMYRATIDVINAIRSDCQVIGITGGGRSPWGMFYDHIFVESPIQKENFLKETRYQQHQVSILPKLVKMQKKLQREKTFDIVNVGDFKSGKNQQALIPLMDKWKIVLMGSGQLKSKIKKESADKKKPPVFLGNVPNEKVFEILAESKLMVHTSVSEGVPRVIPEAFSQGVPVVALKGVIKWGIKHGHNGLLVSEDELVDSVDKLLNQPGKLKEMAKNARRTFEENFKPENCYQKFKRILKKLKTDFTLWEGILRKIYRKSLWLFHTLIFDNLNRIKGWVKQRLPDRSKLRKFLRWIYLKILDLSRKFV